METGPLPQVVPFPHITHPAPADKPLPHQKPLTCLCFEASQALFSAGLSLSVYTCLPSYLCPLPRPRLAPQPGSLPLLGRLPLYPPRPSAQRSHIPSQYPLLQQPYPGPCPSLLPTHPRQPRLPDPTWFSFPSLCPLARPGPFPQPEPLPQPMPPSLDWPPF